MGDADVAMALTDGTAFIVTGKGNAFGAFIERSFGRPSFDEPGTVIEAKLPRPQVARIPALRALRSALLSLRCSAVVGAPPAPEVGLLIPAVRNSDTLAPASHRHGRRRPAIHAWRF